jgi:subtilase family serine protease
MKRTAAVVAFVALTACASPQASVPNVAVPSSPSTTTAVSSAAAPARRSNNARPANGAGALPGNGAGALPGATLPCSVSTSQGEASCTIAINVNLPPISDASTPSNLIPGLHPSDLQSAYALPSQNHGETVAVIDAYDDPSAESDLAVYRSIFGMAPCTIGNGCLRKVNQSGQTGSYPAANAAWAQEVAIDLDMVSAACPNCSIVLVEANSSNVDDLGASVDTAVRLGARAVSNSYYAPEWPGETSEDVHYNHRGTAITVSSGDQASPFYPAASQYVTSVGGTSLSGSAGRWSETAWSYGGSGCSGYEARPKFQASGVPCSTRATVDVAAVADPQTGVATFSTAAGGWVVAGGTSVGAPLIAAAYALSANNQGPAYSYAHKTGFHDIAPAGYDLATGLGSPNGVGGL